MRIVVTGGTGKLGQWVVRELIGQGDGQCRHDVVVIDRLPGVAQPGVTYVTGDLLDPEQVSDAARGADAIIHLAAIPRPGLTSDEELFRTNVMGTFNVHEAALRQGVRRVVSASSQAILGWEYATNLFPPAYLPVDEQHPIEPEDAYGLSKEVVESIARSFGRRGLETVVLRPNWVITPEELDELARKGGREPTKFRLFSYVDARDAASAFHLAAEVHGVPPGSVMFIVADDTAVGEPLAGLLPRLMPEIGDKAAHLTGSRPAISNQRAKDLLGWRPLRSWRTQAHE
jgi:nucleoside-diphosphate-sugar epimerase